MHQPLRAWGCVKEFAKLGMQTIKIFLMSACRAHDIGKTNFSFRTGETLVARILTLLSVHQVSLQANHNHMSGAGDI